MIFLRQGHNTITVNQAIKEKKDYKCLVGMIKEQKEIQYNRPQVLIGPPLVILLTEHGIYEDL